MYSNNNIEQWRNYGREVKDIRDHLLKITVHPVYQKLLPKKEREYLVLITSVIGILIPLAALKIMLK